MPVDKKDVTNRAVVGTFQVKLMLSQQRELTISGHVYSDDEAGDINARVDAYQDVADRQLVRADIFNKEAQIEALTANVLQARDQLGDLSEKQKAIESGGKGVGGNRLRITSQEKQILENGVTAVTAMERQVVSLKAAVAKAREKIAKG